MSRILFAKLKRWESLPRRSLLVLSACSLSACCLSFAQGEGDVDEAEGLVAGGDCIDDFDVFAENFEEDLDEDFFDKVGVGSGFEGQKESSKGLEERKSARCVERRSLRV